MRQAHREKIVIFLHFLALFLWLLLMECASGLLAHCFSHAFSGLLSVPIQIGRLGVMLGIQSDLAWCTSTTKPRRGWGHAQSLAVHTYTTHCYIVRARALQCILTPFIYIYNIHMFIRLHAVDSIKLDLITKTLQLQDPEEICEAVFGGGQNQHFEAAGQSLGSLQLCDD